MRHITRFQARYWRKRGAEHPVVWFWLEARAATVFTAMRDHLDTLLPGSQFVISDAGRTYEQQAALKKAKGLWAATPGKSWHEAGRAIDVDTAATSAALANILHNKHLVAPQYAGEIALLEKAARRGRQALLEAYMAQFGWKRRILKEPWHFEYDYAGGFPYSPVTAAAGIAYINNSEGRR